jgi:hypothetical protein
MRFVRFGLIFAIIAGIAMHFVGDGLSPIHNMISDAATTIPGAILLGISCAGLAVVAISLAAMARHHPRARVLSPIIYLWVAALVVIVAFPTNTPGTALTNSAVVHRYGAALIAVIPPIVGLIVAKTGRLRTISWWTAGSAALFGAVHVPAVLQGTDYVPYAGLAERVLFGLILTLLWQISTDLTASPVTTAPAASPAAQAPEPIQLKVAA